MSCSLVAEKFGLDVACCGSCHDDADDFGYAMCVLIGDDWSEIEVCCAVSNALEARGISDEEVCAAFRGT